MGGPWEKYAAQPQQSGPWDKYAQPSSESTLTPEMQQNLALNAQPTQFEKDRPGANMTTGEHVLDFLKTTAKNLIPSGGAASPYYNMAAPQGSPAQQMVQNSNQQAAQDLTNQRVFRKQAGYGIPYRVAAEVAPLLQTVIPPLVVNPAGAEKAAAQARTGAVLGNTVGPPAAITALAGVSALANRAPKAMPRETAVDQLTNAVNPAPEEMPKFRADLNQHLDSILQYAKENNIPVTKGVSGFAEAAAKTGRAARDFYEQKILNPADKLGDVEVPRDAQVGSQRGEYGRSATLSQIDKRLTEINNTLYPKYQKGGIAAQAAVGSEQAAALRAEQGQLLGILTNELSKRLDIPVEQVSAIRQKAGALRQMGEDVQYYADQAKHSINKIANEPIKGDMRASAYALQQGQIAYRRRFGTPSDKAVGEVATRYTPSAPATITPTPLTRSGAPIRVPAWMQQSAGPQ